MKLSVIIPCYNAAGTLSVQLDALANQSWDQPWEIILADNRSTDNSLEIAERYADKLPNLKIIEAREKQSASYAANAAVLAAEGDALAFCDADDEVAQGWVAAMGNALADHEFVACRVETKKLNEGWLYEALGGHAQQHSIPHCPYPPYLPYAGAGTIGVKRYLHEKVGGFDETLLYVQDADYCFKIQQLGVKLQYVPEAVIHVRLRHTMLGLFQQARNWAQYNVKVYKRYRCANGPDLKYPWVTYGFRWLQLIRLLPRVMDKKTRALIMWILGYQIGLLHGSVQEGVPPVPN